MREELIQIRLVAEDFAATLRFYSALMHDACVSGAPQKGYARLWSQSEQPRAELEIFSRPLAAEVFPEPSAAAPVALVYVTDDVDAVVARLRDVGAEILDEPQDEGPGTTRCARLRSPGGELVEVKTPQTTHWGLLFE